VSTYEAPAKVNLSLLVSPPRSDGYHPLQSLVQTVEWCDTLEANRAEDGEDSLDSRIEDNLVLRALAVVREVGEVPPLSVRLEKQIPVGAGLGGGSSDAAATLLAASRIGSVPSAALASVASRVGADVSLFLEGGTVMMSGIGEQVEEMTPATGFALGIVVPGFGLDTAEVYARWDHLEGPEGETVPDGSLPHSLRAGMPMRNDLLPAAIDLEPRLGDFMADVRAVWGSAVCLTGSGSGCFGYFATVDEAADAVMAVSHLIGEGRGVALRDHGVAQRVHRAG